MSDSIEEIISQVQDGNLSVETAERLIEEQIRMRQCPHCRPDNPESGEPKVWGVDQGDLPPLPSVGPLISSRDCRPEKPEPKRTQDIPDAAANRPFEIYPVWR
jgi:hypothetical protein